MFSWCQVSAPDALLGFAPTRATAEPPQLPDCFRNTSNFKYTRDQQCAEFPDALTPEERQFYEDNGYLIKRGIVPEWLRNKMNGHFTDLVQGKAALGGMTLIRDLGMLRKVKQGLLPQEYKTSELGVYKVQGRFSDTFMEWVSS